MAMNLKYASLIVLCVQNSLLATLMRLSRMGNDNEMYNASTAVVLGEIMKIIVCIIIVFRVSQNGNI